MFGPLNALGEDLELGKGGGNGLTVRMVRTDAEERLIDF